MTAAPASAPGILWHVTILVSGKPTATSQISAAMRRLCDLDPGNMGARYQADPAELQFWDEGADIEQVMVAAVRLWQRSRAAAGLPDWSLVGVEVLDRGLWRERQAAPASPIAPGSVSPLG